MRAKLTDNEFNRLKNFVYNNYGINLAQKRTLVEGRLTSVLKSKDLDNFGAYIDLLFKDTSGQEISTFLDCITTNHTFFMREIEHFEFLRDVILPELEKKHATNQSMKIWSAGCSSGQEAYTAAMFIDKYFGARKGNWDTRLLASDISQSILESARKAEYPLSSVADIPLDMRNTYTIISQTNKTFTMTDRIKNEVLFRTINLMEEFNFKNKRPFDLIFCRNVMIYFDQETKVKLVRRFFDATAPGGYLFVGLSENISRCTNDYKMIKTGIYQKPFK